MVVAYNKSLIEVVAYNKSLEEKGGREMSLRVV